jgi:8-oxo-dGTP pyrophosphatase MutT (NUDIX family)
MERGKSVSSIKSNTVAALPRPAATAILVREGKGGIEVYLLRRSAKSEFMPGNYVFPGGNVDAQDRDPSFWAAHADMGLDAVSTRLGGGGAPEDVLAYAVAVVRETFEEAGVFLGARCSEVRGLLAELRKQRLNSGLKPGWLRDLVGGGDWMLSLSRLGRWSHWVTPDIMPKRFDTRFFLAFAPRDQECAPDASETTHGLWIRPGAALSGNLEGRILLSPPTLANLNDLLRFPSIQELQAEVESRGWGPPRSPRPLVLGSTVLNIMPWDPLFHRVEEIDTSNIDATPLPVGAPFSRVVLQDGVWRPVK